jgi:hypothetical protein
MELDLAIVLRVLRPTQNTIFSETPRNDERANFLKNLVVATKSLTSLLGRYSLACGLALLICLDGG